jgi:hypothetical protein
LVGLTSLAMTFCAPCCAASASTSSLPIWPLAPMTRIFAVHLIVS